MIFVATEGNVDEPSYIEELKPILQTANVTTRIVLLDRQVCDTQSHPNHVRDGILEFYQKHLKEIFRHDDELWILFDIDNHFGPRGKASSVEKYMSFLDSLKQSENHPEINPAVSSPSFELWGILHYMEPDDLDKDKIFRNQKTNGSTYLKRRFSELWNENGRCFTKQNVLLAIQRAERGLLNQDVENMIREPGTTVHFLLKKVFTD